ncbi:MAG: FtsX-like permease family protein, partial [Cyclobacteriaceae bacterium]|nr:FtsX-like permease family protein [Cyclobacteriaceae bacterium]
ANLGIALPLEFVQLRKSEGDDASCLNLNRVTAPRILGLPTAPLKGRFSFVQSTQELDADDPWTSLKTPLAGDVIPAIADQTVIQWGLGMAVGDTLVYLDEAGQEMKLKLIGGLANSIFQGNILIDEALFLKHFPSSSGTHVFLVDAATTDREAATEVLARAFRNEGTEITPAADRLAAFNQVENTYLSIFMLLGGLAMIIGTIGLGIVLVRNILDRVQEVGILQAIGFKKRDVMRLIIREHLVLLLLGTLSGTLAAFMAILPSLLSEFVTASWHTAVVIIALVLANGYVWVALITRRVLRGGVWDGVRGE